MALKMARFDCTYVHRTGKYNIADYYSMHPIHRQTQSLWRLCPKPCPEEKKSRPQQMIVNYRCSKHGLEHIQSHDYQSVYIGTGMYRTS